MVGNRNIFLGSQEAYIQTCGIVVFDNVACHDMLQCNVTCFNLIWCAGQGSGKGICLELPRSRV